MTGGAIDFDSSHTSKIIETTPLAAPTPTAL
jgi:hypothetical protein